MVRESVCGERIALKRCANPKARAQIRDVRVGGNTKGKGLPVPFYGLFGISMGVHTTPEPLPEQSCSSGKRARATGDGLVAERTELQRRLGARHAQLVAAIEHAVSAAIHADGTLL